jgi:hypothetical protein
MAIDGVTPHIYGKRETRPFRKMGHVTIVNENMNEARKIAEEVKNSIRVISPLSKSVNFKSIIMYENHQSLNFKQFKNIKLKNEQSSHNNGKHLRYARNARSHRHLKRI